MLNPRSKITVDGNTYCLNFLFKDKDWELRTKPVARGEESRVIVKFMIVQNPDDTEKKVFPSQEPPESGNDRDAYFQALNIVTAWAAGAL